MTAATDERAFLDHVADRLAGLPHVRAVALGGSRAEGTHTPDSDWDVAVYYRGGFDPGRLRALAGPDWAGEASAIGGWGGGVFNGGAWLTVRGRRVDVHYRDLDVVEHELEQAGQGRFRVEPLMFHLAGIPSYLVVAELAVNRVLRGELPRPDGYPPALREAAVAEWWGRAGITLVYAEHHSAPRGGVTEVAGAVAVAAMQTAHAVLAARGEWVTNEKRLVERAGLRAVDAILGEAAAGERGVAPRRLADAVAHARTLFEDAVEAAQA